MIVQKQGISNSNKDVPCNFLLLTLEESRVQEDQRKEWKAKQQIFLSLSSFLCTSWPILPSQQYQLPPNTGTREKEKEESRKGSKEISRRGR